ncbi:ARM repeat-containing protein [Basidiobolus meristosporus CBS 931.73]|uniref:ARM repeat-containing protein n=1 Tax=Basidiobolus meristosporus CBS 931.73 TaxID=1314790 RepID=A0A1Y1Y9C5_9FUNG|nr:ARM repeat-containing protein [Basidiobolus meristosporus CBS 931.73]|eukprot:ORX94611.1 ARM repeat-containing protein [Basidiobolus meristosporus CBS 931.73]
MDSEEQRDTSALKKLKFNQKLSSTAKPLATNELMKRLKNLHNELAHLDQEEVDTQSMSTVTRELLSSSLMRHKDKGVRIHVACCIADLLRLYAPDAPYTDRELRDVFDFFVKQLQYVGQSVNPYFPLYFYLLESLSTVKSVVLVVDLNNADELITDFFRTFFDIVHDEQSKNVQLCMVDILQQLIDEGSSLPQDVVDIILAQFLKRRQEENPAAFKMATDLCNGTADRLQRYVCQYFADVILAAGKEGTTQEDMEDYRTAHQLIKELNRVTPGLLLNVIPQLEEELTLDDLNLRTLATTILGEMFAETGTSLAKSYPTVWKSWLQRRNDKVTALRCAWVDFSVDLLTNHPELGKDVIQCLISKSSDPEEKVRISVCKALGRLEFQTIFDLVDKELLIQIGHRCRDKKIGPRQEAIKTLGHLYNLAYNEIANQDISVVSKFGWIPNILFKLFYIDDNETFAAVEKAIHDDIFPANNDDEQRSERVLIVLGSLDEKARKAFLALISRQSVIIKEGLMYLDFCEKYNSGNADEKTENILHQIIKRISDKFPDPTKAATHLSKFAKITDARLYKAFKEFLDIDADYKSIKKASGVFLKRLEQTSSSLLDTFSIFVRRASLTIVNKNLIPYLVRLIKSTSPEDLGDSSLGAVAHGLLKDISTMFPMLYRTHVKDFAKLLQEESSTLVADGLEALSQFVKAFPEETPNDPKSLNRLVQCILEGGPSQAKFATIIICHAQAKEQYCSQILQEIVPNLSSDSPHLLSHLSALSQIVLHAPEAFESYSDSVIPFVVKNILMQPSQVESGSSEEEWEEYEKIHDECKAKLYGIKILVNRLIGLANDEINHELAQPAFKMLWKIIKENGEILGGDSTNPVHRSYLRLAAAVSVLKLARHPVYEKMIAQSDFNWLALTAQDPCFQVRSAFVSKLIKYLGRKVLHVRYLPILFLVAHDPEKEIRTMVKGFFYRQTSSRAIRENNPSLFEVISARLIHLLAHHPDFSKELNDLKLFVKYIEFYLENIANAENIALIYHIIVQLKTVRDRITPPKTENLYILSEMAQLLVQEKSHSAGWTLASYPGQVKLPMDLFETLLDSSEVVMQVYLPDEFKRTRISAQAHRGVRTEKVSNRCRARERPREC